MKKKFKHDRIDIERSIIKCFRRQIWHPFAKALTDYEMIDEGDRIAICISGGKDSMLLAKCMQEMKAHGKTKFDLKFLVMDPGYNKANRKLIEENAAQMGIPITIFESDIFEAVTHIDDSPCYLCARMRRGFLYAKAKELHCNKIALGHHMDDAIETVLMSILYGGQYNIMMPKLKSQNFDGMELIRPLYYIRETDIIAWKEYNELTFLRCACRFTEKIEEGRLDGKAGKISKRTKMKELIASLSKESSSIPLNILRSATNVNLDQCIGYTYHGKRYHFLEDYNKDNKEKQIAYTYILRCADGTYYCGWTDDIDERIKTHNDRKGAKYTRGRTPVKLVYLEQYDTKSEAMSREYAIKRLSRKQKEELISNYKKLQQSDKKLQIKNSP